MRREKMKATSQSRLCYGGGSSLSTWRNIWRYRNLYIMLIPGILFIVVFCYVPMAGLAVAFKDYKIFAGFSASPWIGLDNFKKLFETPNFYRVMRNTLIISGYKIIFGFPIPIVLALMLNELRTKWYARTVQTIVYLPHFFSWVVVYGLTFLLCSPKDGMVNIIIQALGGDPIFFLGDTKWFRFTLVVSEIWKETGWNAIVYIAALAAVPLELFEAGAIDGASRLQKAWHIALPCILPTISIMLLLRLGNVLNAGFEQVYIMLNSAVYSVGDILDTYIYRYGIIQTQYGYTTAVGLFKSVISCSLVLLANWAARKSGQESII